MRRSRRRWSDHDRHFGPLTYARDRGWRPLALVLSSGDGGEYPGASLRLSCLGHTLILEVPPLVRPWRVWVDTSGYSWGRGGAGGYWDSGARQYGFTLSDGHLSIALGRQTSDSRTEQRWGWHLPWCQWRHVRRSLYDLDGRHWWTAPSGGARLGEASWEAVRQAEAACPHRVYAFVDADGECLTARVRIEEREWRWGAGWFRWLSLLRRPRTERYLSIEFSGETGRGKGSWKGGVLGTSTRVMLDDTHLAAFWRYCDEHGMRLLGVASDDPLYSPSATG